MNVKKGRLFEGFFEWNDQFLEKFTDQLSLPLSSSAAVRDRV